MNIHPFNIAISDEALTDLNARLSRTRWMAGIDDAGWSEGTDSEFLKRLVDHWRTEFDWRAQESRLNTLPQFIAQVGSQPIHFVHQLGTGPAPLPLILTHGWPGSFVEMEAIIPLLADPARYGGDPQDAFHVVVPSLPGYGFSPAPSTKGTGPFEIAGLWAELMRGLGYEQFGAQGGDWGSSVSTWLAYRYPERVKGLHLNYLPGSYRPPLGPDQPPLSDEEQGFLDKAAAWAEQEGAYAKIQGTKPQTLAFGLNDSPAGLAAWIVEKFQAWSDCGGELEQAISLDALLTNVSIYWFTGTIGSSFRLYLESRKRPVQFSAGQRVLPPLGVAHFPGELPMPPRSWVERSFNLQRWTEMEHGGHFAAMEQPQALAQEIRALFRPLR
ncbi:MULTISPECIES: epoxide hydrolase [unclassified Pseudomonas]|uniref:epoxide hydrolase family protein n=1 Tax=unclassified Pseudomonas TaxID=196821 RepID=UPI002AC9B512|nr:MULTISPECIES: epoxide hydrolase [unclassified Pseudomonas]MEB0040889.1 epoxide hydrolase [Pseudomonas sp. MH10]MEB0119452.1 epoxide hydrolase [Pseudomonas sp. CCI1.2]WPX65778.1 epoxide hydrolase [Pseudomonas sp. MH10]